MVWLYYIFFFCAGATIGSFLNVVIDRLPQNRSIVSPPSSCENCRQQLKAIDLVPVFSYIWLRGKCRYCGASVPLRIVLVEISCALLFVLLFWRFGLSWVLFCGIAYTCIFIVLSVIDLEHLELPDSIIFAAMPLALILHTLLSHEVSGLYFSYPWFSLPLYLSNLLNSIVGAAISFVFLFLVALIALKLFKKEGMGGGDVKLAALIGLMLGFPMVLLSLYISIIGGAVISVLIVLLRRRGWKDAVPFGPFLCLGALITFIWGSQILQWYMATLM